VNWIRGELVGAFWALMCALVIVLPLFLAGLLPKPWASIIAVAWWFLVLPLSAATGYRRARRRWRAEQERAKKAEEALAVDLSRALQTVADASDDTDAAKAGLHIVQTIREHSKDEP
jgi:hypothetical protein